MIRNKSDFTEKPVIDLNGPDGNAYVLLGMAKGWAKQLGLEWIPIQNKMLSGNYENLIATLEEFFGDFIILER